MNSPKLQNYWLTPMVNQWNIILSQHVFLTSVSQLRCSDF